MHRTVIDYHHHPVTLRLETLDDFGQPWTLSHKDHQRQILDNISVYTNYCCYVFLALYFIITRAIFETHCFVQKWAEENASLVGIKNAM